LLHSSSIAPKGAEGAIVCVIFMVVAYRHDISYVKYEVRTELEEAVPYGRRSPSTQFEGGKMHFESLLSCLFLGMCGGRSSSQ
jgi:hypothetical protein